MRSDKDVIECEAGCGEITWASEIGKERSLSKSIMKSSTEPLLLDCLVRSRWIWSGSTFPVFSGLHVLLDVVSECGSTESVRFDISAELERLWEGDLLAANFCDRCFESDRSSPTEVLELLYMLGVGTLLRVATTSDDRRALTGR